MKNWKKDNDKNNDRKYEGSELPASQSKETNEKGNVSEVDKGEGSGILSEAEMNKLGARIVKAEIMGDEVHYYYVINFFIIMLFICFSSYDICILQSCFY